MRSRWPSAAIMRWRPACSPRRASKTSGTFHVAGRIGLMRLKFRRAFRRRQDRIGDGIDDEKLAGGADLVEVVDHIRCHGSGGGRSRSYGTNGRRDEVCLRFISQIFKRIREAVFAFVKFFQDAAILPERV